MDGIADLLGRLREAELEVSEREISDALWLAVQMNSAEAGIGQARRGPVSERPTAPATSSHIPEPEPYPPHPVPPWRPLWHPLPAYGAALVAERHGPPVRLSAFSEVRDKIELQRAIRPLRRTIEGRSATVLDEETTALDSADAGAVIPALVPARERWLSLALVLDTSQSMSLWPGLMDELRDLLAQTGAFRVVSRWRLEFPGGTAAISPEGSGRPRGIRELADPEGRLAILVITDCISSAWRTGAAMRAVAAWAKTSPVALLQPLPMRLWPQRQVRCSRMQLRSPYPGAPNRRLLPAGIPVPVLEIAPRWLASWATLVSGTGPARSMVAFADAETPAGDAADRQEPEEAAESEETDPQIVVERFMASASSGAFRLAGLLAAAPLTLPLMRLIQRIMLPDPLPLQLAEVYLGGLLRAIPSETGIPGVTYFDFLPGVRETLLDTITRSDAIAVNELVQQIKLDALAASEPLSAEPSRISGQGPVSFNALLNAAQGSTRRTLPSADESYAAIETQVLRRVGGRYAEVVTGEVPLPPPGRQVPSPTLPDLVLVPAIPSSETPHGPIEISSRDQWHSWSPDPADVPNHADTALKDEYGVTMLGAPGSGKTTFLAALPIALAGREDQWSLTGVDTASTNMLIWLTARLTQFRTFPHATSDVELYRWLLYGQFPSQAVRPRRRARQSAERVEVGLRLADHSGEISSAVKIHKSRDNLINTLVKSRGIVYLFDPVRQSANPDAYDHSFGLIAELATRMRGTPDFVGGRLPHYLAICLSKSDQPAILEAATSERLLSVDPGDSFRFPRIHDEDAKEFFNGLSDEFRTSDMRRVLRTFESWFRPDRIKYFVTSAIGFYVDPSTGLYNRDDYQNQLPATYPERIRGPARPINVAEPMLWLSEVLRQSRRR